VNPRDVFSTPALDVRRLPAGGARLAWRAAATLAAAAVAWLVFSAYRRPDFLLDLAAGLGLC